ncbi:MAG TPA: type II toxin-antitoxin system VapC family toxin [Candidatus Limnocylindrales bacterium]|nr:type II toxin-antitoxin system VapC family toxin [Candidatus Limnocylindrales bacterium]
MIVYLDTSVVLRVLLKEPNPIDIWGRWDKAFSSALWRIEALRTVDRLRLMHEITDTEVADLVRDVQTTHETLAIYPLHDRIMQRASETFPTVVGTLDAIHLASAIFIREAQSIDLLLTHDSRLATAARSLGFRVMGTD